MAYKMKRPNTRATEAGKPRGFAPLEPGNYAVSLYEVTTGEYQRGGNEGKGFVKVQFKVLDGQKGANRRLYGSIGKFPEWAPTDKNPDGSDNFTFFKFFAAVQGKTEKEFRAEVDEWFDSLTEKQLDEGVEFPESLVPSRSALEGRKVVVTLGVIHDKYNYDKARAQAESDGEDPDDLNPDDFKTNEVKNYKVYDGTLPAAGAAQTSAPKVEAVDL